MTDVGERAQEIAGRHIRDAARKIIDCSNEELLSIAKHDPDCFRDVAASLLTTDNAQQRYAYIVQQVRTYGRVNRADIQREFSVSVPQASADLQVVMSDLRYNKSKKYYEPLEQRNAD